MLFSVILCLNKESYAVQKNDLKQEIPTKIRSKIIDIKRKSQIIDFFDNVIVEKGDSSLLADEMRVVYEEKKKGKSSSVVKRIDAKKNVKVFSEEFIATGEIGHYDPKKNIFMLEKNVIVNNGVSVASGDKFIYNITTKKGDFIGGKHESNIDGREDKRVIVIIGNEIEQEKE